MRSSLRRSELSAAYLAAAAMYCCGWGGNQFTPLLILYRTHNGLSEVLVDALLAAYVFGLGPALLIGSRASDRYGRKTLIATALCASVLGSLALSLDSLAMLFVGRLLSGIGVGLAMAVGTTWAVELTVREGGAATLGARRAAVALTAGPAIGAAVAGALAQWGPMPTSLPYWVQAAVALPTLALVVLAGTETVTASHAGPAVPVEPTPLDGDLLERGVRPRSRFGAPAVNHPRFRRLVLPMAPWIFGVCGVAYATVPGAMAQQVSGWSLIYATLLSVLTLGAGVLIQPLAHRLDLRPDRPAGRVGMAVITGGLALAGVSVALGSPVLGALTAIVLGCAYGIAIVAGLLEVQRLTEPEHLARTTGIYYATAYLGFLFPMLIALSGDTTGALWVLTGLAGLCGLSVARSAGPRRALTRGTATTETV